MTLIELVTAVTLIGILAAMAVPAFISTSNSNRLSGLGNDVAGLIQGVRLEAVRTGRRAIICPTTDNVTCDATAQWGGWLAFIDANGDAAPQAAEIRRTELVRAPLQLWASDAISTSGNRVVFRPDGFTYGNDGELLEGTLSACILTASPEQNVRDVVVSAAGSVAVRRRDADGACDGLAD